MNSGIFVLGFVLAIFGFISDITNYYDRYALVLIIIGLVLIVIGALMPTIRTSTEQKEIVVPERRKKTIVTEE